MDRAEENVSHLISYSCKCFHFWPSATEQQKKIDEKERKKSTINSVVIKHQTPFSCFKVNADKFLPTKYKFILYHTHESEENCRKIAATNSVV